MQFEWDILQCLLVEQAIGNVNCIGHCIMFHSDIEFAESRLEECVPSVVISGRQNVYQHEYLLIYT